MSQQNSSQKTASTSPGPKISLGTGMPQTPFQEAVEEWSVEAIGHIEQCLEKKEWAFRSLAYRPIFSLSKLVHTAILIRGYADIDQPNSTTSDYASKMLALEQKAIKKLNEDIGSESTAIALKAAEIVLEFRLEDF